MGNTRDDHWERLEQVIGEVGLSINSFARQIGLPRGENLYQIKRGNYGISEDVARRIHNQFPQYSVAWLLCGEELVPVTAVGNTPVVRIPVYRNVWMLQNTPQGTAELPAQDSAAEEPKDPLKGTAGNSAQGTAGYPPQDPPREELILSEAFAGRAQLAMPYGDDILNPYLRDAVLLLRESRLDEIVYGNIYLVMTARIRIFRIVLADDDNPSNIRLTTSDPERHSDLTIPRQHITAIWSVVGAICQMVR